MDRRIFMSSAVAGLAAATSLAEPAQAMAMQEWTNVVFSADDPGHWGGQLAALHVPQVEVKDGMVSVTTPHPMTQNHYIVSHTVVLEGGRFLDRKTFSWNDKPVSTHALPAGYKGRITVTSTCNLHDWWVQEITA